jgi:hypothetical protein
VNFQTLHRYITKETIELASLDALYINALGLKYNCPYTRLNTLRITDMNGVGDPQAYYEDPNTWAAKRSHTSSSTLPEYNIPLTCNTTALSGATVQFYEFDVQIVLAPLGN